MACKLAALVLGSASTDTTKGCVQSKVAGTLSRHTGIAVLQSLQMKSPEGYAKLLSDWG